MAIVSAHTTSKGSDIDVSSIGRNGKLEITSTRNPPSGDSDHFKSVLNGGDQKASEGSSTKDSDNGTFKANFMGGDNGPTLTTMGQLRENQNLHITTDDNKFAFNRDNLPEGTVTLTKDTSLGSVTGSQGGNDSPASNDKPAGDNKGGNDSPVSNDSERVMDDSSERGGRVRRERGSDKPVTPNWNNDAIIDSWLNAPNNAYAQNAGATGNYY